MICQCISETVVSSEATIGLVFPLVDITLHLRCIVSKGLEGEHCTIGNNRAFTANIVPLEDMISEGLQK